MVHPKALRCQEIRKDEESRAGRTVRVVEQGKPRAAGNNTVLWDGRSQTGVIAPPGMYLLQVTAEAESGEKVRALSPLRLQ